MNIVTRIKAAATGFKMGARFFATSPYDEYLTGPEDDIIQKKGTEGYETMVQTDPEVSTSMMHFVDLSIPGVSITPGGSDPADIRNGELCKAILLDMDGSVREPFAYGFRNAGTTGFSIMEPIWERKIIQGIGPVIGLKGIYTRPSSSFANYGHNGIVTDDSGNIIMFKQLGSSNHSAVEVEPGEVLYYAYQGNANNRYGSSVLRPVYEPWAAKIKIRRIYQVFLATNASGIRHGKMPYTEWTDSAKRAKALDALKKMGSMQAFVSAKEMELDINIPSSGAGSHFKDALEFFNEEIRRAILGDSSFSGTTGSEGTYGSKMAAQSNVRTRFQIQGNAFCDAIGEQLFPMILEMNGYTDGRIPHLQPVAIATSEEERAQSLYMLSEMKQSGLLTITPSKEAQLQILANGFKPLGIEINTIDEAEAQDEEKQEQKQPEQVAAAERKIQAASASVSRARKDARKLSGLIDESASDLASTWQTVMPQIIEQLSKQLFEQRAGGGWKTTDLTKIRQIVQDGVKYKSGEVRKAIAAGYEKAANGGSESAQAVLPVKAASSIGWSSATAKAALQNRVMLLLEDKYSALASQMYYAIENALVGQVSVQVAEEAIRDVLAGSPFSASRAATILDTAMASAWNTARMQQYLTLENPDGTKSTDIVGYEFAAVMDDNTTDQCMELNGKYFKAGDASLPQPPLHYNCRSQLVPIFGDERDKYEDKFLTRSESSALVSRLVNAGQIQPGFGGIT